MKKLFGGAQKKPLMTQVSVRHLNEIVRERNQYSRDAAEAWQDFINLKGRMDTEVAKVTKRNNFLVEELESWKQQFLKFQAFAEQLTKETQDLKVKIENHKRENRRLTSLIDQHKDDMQRLSVRLSGTEKQRDDALEALVLQQEIAEELERERKRNKKDLTNLQNTNTNLLRQRDETQRVVLHLRALIDGQAVHMEHVVKSLHQAPEMQNMFVEAGAEGSTERDGTSRGQGRSTSAQSNRLSMSDVADRFLREKTDSIAYIIRNISEQCAAAVEGLQLAQRAETVNEMSPRPKTSSYLSPTEDGFNNDEETNRTDRNSIPSTPDLYHHHRASTAMSYTTDGTAMREMETSLPELPTRVLEPELVGQTMPQDDGVQSKHYPQVHTAEGDRLRMGLA